MTENTTPSTMGEIIIPLSYTNGIGKSTIAYALHRIGREAGLSTTIVDAATESVRTASYGELKRLVDEQRRRHDLVILDTVSVPNRAYTYTGQHLEDAWRLGIAWEATSGLSSAAWVDRLLELTHAPRERSLGLMNLVRSEPGHVATTSDKKWFDDAGFWCEFMGNIAYHEDIRQTPVDDLEDLRVGALGPVCEAVLNRANPSWNIPAHTY